MYVGPDPLWGMSDCATKRNENSSWPFLWVHFTVLYYTCTCICIWTLVHVHSYYMVHVHSYWLVHSHYMVHVHSHVHSQWICSCHGVWGVLHPCIRGCNGHMLWCGITTWHMQDHVFWYGIDMEARIGANCMLLVHFILQVYLSQRISNDILSLLHVHVYCSIHFVTLEFSEVL